jgi:hypothetical protein
MRCRPSLSLVPAVLLLLVAADGVSRADSPAPLLPSAAAHYPPGAHYKPLCPNPDAHGQRCFGQILVDADDRPISHPTSPPGGWTPTELEKAYGLPANGGAGTVIATFIGSHYTNAESDVAAYRSMFGMTPCTSANGCFTQITDTGGTDFSGLNDDGCSGFVGEESLDVDMLMAGCPSCKILIIEGNDNASAITTAKNHGAVSMSMSWGYGPVGSDCDNIWIPQAGLALFAASGDSGYTASPGAPAACPKVVAVGWTQLATDSSARGYADTIPSGWGSAGGCVSGVTKQSWQTDTGCSSRMISDISANGDNVAAYCTSPSGSANWHVTGGSSASSPFTTGVLATLGITGGSFEPSWLYMHQANFWDVTSGGPVGGCPGGSPDYFCNAVAGYDGPTGVGTPYGPMLEGLGTGTGMSDAGAGDAGTGPACVTPGGSYSQSCTGCAARPMGPGCVLTCSSCTEMNGGQSSNPSLALPCNGMIVNNNGALQCVGSAGGDAGSNTDGGPQGSADAGATSDPDGGGPLGGTDAGVVSPPDDASTGNGFGFGPGAGSGSAGCTCTEARGARSPMSTAVGGLVVLGWGLRRRRKSARVTQRGRLLT